MKVNTTSKSRLYLSIAHIAGGRPPAICSCYESFRDMPEEIQSELIDWARQNSRLHWVAAEDLIKAAEILAESKKTEEALCMS